VEPHEYITILRRRWRVVVAFFVSGVLLALVLPTPDPARAAQVWRAEAVLVSVSSGEDAPPLGVVGLLAKSDAVLKGVVEDVPGIEDPNVVASLTEASRSEDGLVTITAIGGGEDEAEALANALAARVAEQAGSQLEAWREQQIAQLQARVQQLPPSTATGGSQAGTEDGRTQLESQIAQLRAASAAPPLALLQPAVARPEESGGGLSPPTDPVARILLFAGLGLLVGVVIALVVERVDPRLLTPGELARVHRLPLLVNVPAVVPTRGGLPSTARSPDSSAADAFRALRMSLLLASPRVPGVEADDSRGRHQSSEPAVARRPVALDTSRVVLFTAGRTGAGVTTTVTNLAAAFAASGMSVIVLDADQRSQSLTDDLGLQGGRGVSDLLAQADITTEDVSSVAAPVPALPGVRVLTAGSTLAFHGADPARTGQLLEGARQCAQVVLVDAAALLESVEALELAPFVDGVVIVARPGATTREGAGQVSGALNQLRIPAFGLVSVSGRASDRVRSAAGGIWRRSNGKPQSEQESAHEPADAPRPPRHVRDRGGDQASVLR
jgi:Mrp family chromosome partitioning ATPase